MLHRHLNLKDDGIGSMVANRLEGSVGAIGVPNDDGACATAFDDVSHDLATLGSGVDEDDPDATRAGRRGCCHAHGQILKAVEDGDGGCFLSTNSEGPGPLTALYAWPASYTHSGGLSYGFAAG
jgi:hypothetical protein